MEIYGKNTYVFIGGVFKKFFLIVMMPQWNPNKTTVGRQGEPECISGKYLVVIDTLSFFISF